MNNPVEISQSELNDTYSELVKRRAEIIETEKRYEELELKALSYDSTTERAPTGYHQADQASNAADQEVYSRLVSIELKRIRDIEDAMERIRKGHYGRCENCDERISPLRLKNVPEARFCENCEAQKEATDKLHRHNSNLDRKDFRR